MSDRAENAESTPTRLLHGHRHLRILNEVCVTVRLDDSLFQFDFGETFGVNCANEREADVSAFGHAGGLNRFLTRALKIRNGNTQSVVAADLVIASVILQVIRSWIGRIGKLLVF